MFDAFNSMRDGIETCPSNWDDCVMWVQDPILASVNITAEISKQEVNNFVEMCKIFAKNVPKTEIQCENAILKTTPATSELIENVNLFSFIEKEMNNIHSASLLEARLRYEIEISATLTKYIQQFDETLKIYAFGSSQYGIKMKNNNFNLLITTSLYLFFIHIIFKYT